MSNSLLELTKLINQLDREKQIHRLKYYVPYAKQRDFHNAKGANGFPAAQKLFMAANQIGKCNSLSVHVDAEEGSKPLISIWGKQANLITWPDLKPRKVLAWVRKPAEECFRITMSDGRWFESPVGHRVLTDDGWQAIGEILPSLPRSAFVAQGFRESVRRGVLRWTGIARGWWGRCFDCFRLRGGQLLSDQEGVQVFAPLADGARGHTLLWWRVGALANRCTSIARRVFSRLSSSGVFSQTSAQFWPCLGQAPCTTVPRLSNYTRGSSLYSPGFRLPNGSRAGQTHRSRSGALAFPGDKEGNSIVSVISVGFHNLYDMQVEGGNYLAAGVVHHNTRAGAAEVAIHATGLYPSWWEGVRFPAGVKILVSGVTNELLRDKPQAELLGPPENEKDLGTGMIPIDKIIPDKLKRKPGVPNAYDTVMVRHISGRPSRIYFRPYEAGAKKFQSVDYDVVWLDEEPPEDVWSQCQRSTFAKKTYVAFITATPEQGMTEVITQFMNNLNRNQALIGATWDDAPHMTDEMKEDKLRTIPLREREMRTKGIPLMGAGLVFPYPDEEFVIDPIAIPRHWPQLNGLDFGWDHPFAAVNVAWDREADIVYVTKCYRTTKEIPLIHCVAVKAWGDWIPCAWPHDGLGTEKGTGKQLVARYREGGLKMLPNHATHPPEPGQEEGKGGYSVEAGITDICQRIETNRFKVFSTCKEWIEEKSMYHRDQKGQLVKLRDDVISASRCAVMMLRFARVHTLHVRPRTPMQGLRNWLNG